MGNKKILDVGCGMNKMEGAIGIDINPNTQADVVHDLNKFPYPFPDSEFDSIICNHIIEHIDDVVPFMEELYRIGKPDCVVEIITPHFTNPCSYRDPTHKRHLSFFSFDYFLRQERAFRPGFWGRALETEYPALTFYTDKKFEKTSNRLSFARPFRLLGIEWFCNHFPNLYEFYFAFVLPARDIYIELRVVK